MAADAWHTCWPVDLLCTFCSGSGQCEGCAGAGFKTQDASKMVVTQKNRAFGAEKDNVLVMTQDKPPDQIPCSRCGGWGGRRGSFRGGHSSAVNSPQAKTEKGGDGKCRPCHGRGKVRQWTTPSCLLKCLPPPTAA